MNNATDNTQLMEKLAKILRLANCKGATQGEVEAAMMRAKALAEKHQIDLAMVSLEDPNEKRSLNITIERKDVAIRSKRFQLYHNSIWDVMYLVFGVRVIRFGNSRFCFVGESTDVLICQELFPWLEDVFYSTYYKAKQAGIVRSCAAHKRGIYEGLARGIAAANKRHKEERTVQEEQCLAMVLRSKQDLIEEQLKDIPEQKEREVDVDFNAYMHGKREGAKIKLNQMSGSGAARTQLSNQ
jgi:hypothetical protein